MVKVLLKLSIGVVFSFFAANATAAVDNIYVFGDSFSDGGSSPTAKYSLIQQSEPQYTNLLAGISPYCGFQNRFTNGLTTVEYAAAMLGKADIANFENYAVAGSDSNAFGNQILEFNKYHTGSTPLGANDLVIIGFGSNDLNNALNGDLTQADGSSHTPESLKVAIWDNIELEMDGLVNEGIKQFIIIGASDFLKKPALLAGLHANNHQVITNFIQQFNSYLQLKIAEYNSNNLGVHAIYFDLLANETQLYSDYASLKSATTTSSDPDGVELFYVYPNTYVTTECQANINLYAPAATASDWDKKVFNYGISNWPSYDRFIYWDGLHWSKRAHMYFGSHLANFINAHFN